MKTLIRQPGFFKAIAGKIAVVLVCALGICALSTSSAYAEHHDGHGQGDRRHEDHGRGGGWRGGPGGYGYGGYGNYGYGYAQPVYVPPPVYAVPVQSPGISLVLPINFR